MVDQEGTMPLGDAALLHSVLRVLFNALTLSVGQLEGIQPVQNQLQLSPKVLFLRTRPTNPGVTPVQLKLSAYALLELVGDTHPKWLQ